jgi:hypothetical protein
MTFLRIVIFIVLIAAPPSGQPAVTSGDLPAGVVWYAHADLAQMRSAEAGKDLYRWLNAEVFIEIHDEIGIDVDKETDRVTAFADGEHGVVIIVEGPVSQETKDKILALAAAKMDMELNLLTSDGKEYYEFGNGMENDADDDFEALEDGGYFSFDLKDKVIVTSTEEQMKALLNSGGRVAGMDSHPAALFVLTADKSLVQAGLRTDEMADEDDDGWDSNILRNTEQAALLIADKDGLIAFEAQLVSSEPGMAQSLGSIINGLIALQSFNDDLDPKIVSLIQNTKVEVEGATLSIKAVIDPAHVITILND